MCAYFGQELEMSVFREERKAGEQTIKPGA
jgi:hypothetical protein